MDVENVWSVKVEKEEEERVKEEAAEDINTKKNALDTM